MAGLGRAFVVAWHEEDTEEALRAAYRAERDVDVRQRLHALWLLRSGKRRMDEVVGLVGTMYRTVQRWGGLASRGRAGGDPDPPHGRHLILRHLNSRAPVGRIMGGKERL